MGQPCAPTAKVIYAIPGIAKRMWRERMMSKPSRLGEIVLFRIDPEACMTSRSQKPYAPTEHQAQMAAKTTGESPVAPEQ